MVAPKKTPAVPPEDRLAQLLAVLEARTKLLAFFFGLCFVAALLVLAVWFPQPTVFQYTVFRIVLALAAAGIAGVIPGMIRLKAQPGTALLIHAGGALAVFVMVYLIAPAALKFEEKQAVPSPPQKEEKPVPAAQPLKISGVDAIVIAPAALKFEEKQAVPSPPQKEEKPVPAAQPLKISGVDAIENGVHILDFTPPLTRHTVRLSNIGEAPVHISLIGFPEKYFYTNLADEKSLLQGHEDRDVSVILMLNVPEQKEYIFEVSDSAGGTERVAVRINEVWGEYIKQQIRNVNEKVEQGASALELYHTAEQIIAFSGYKELSAPLQQVFIAQLLEAAKQPEAAAMAYSKAKKRYPEVAERFITNLSPSLKSIIVKNDTHKINRGSCNKSEYDKAEYFSLQAGKKFVDQFGGGQDVRVEINFCDYNYQNKKFNAEIEIYWNGAIFRRNTYYVDGKLTMDAEGESASFTQTYANVNARNLAFTRIIAGSVLVLGRLVPDTSD